MSYRVVCNRGEGYEGEVVMTEGFATYDEAMKSQHMLGQRLPLNFIMGLRVEQV